MNTNNLLNTNNANNINLSILENNLLNINNANNIDLNVLENNNSFLNYCLDSENKVIVIFHLIFIVAIPLFLIMNHDINVLKLYLLFLVPLAMIVKEIGKPYLFRNLFPVYLYPHNVNPSPVSFASRLIIILMTVTGVLWNAISFSMNRKSVEKGIYLGLMNFILIYFTSLLLIPFTMEKIDNYMVEENRKINKSGNINHRYLIGILLFMMAFLILYMGNVQFRASF